MTDFSTGPHSRRALDPQDLGHLMHRYATIAIESFASPGEFGSHGTVLADHERAMVAIMRVPFAPLYDTRFIFKWFKAEGGDLAHAEQVELEAVSLQHAAEAFRRNNHITKVPEPYYLNTMTDVMTMECIRGRGVRDILIGWWAKERMIRFARQMAVARLATMTQVENQLGVPGLDQTGRVGPYCGLMWWGNQKCRVWDQIYRGPFHNTHEVILASLNRDKFVAAWKRDSGSRTLARSDFDTFEEMISYLERTIDNIDRVPRPTRQELFSLNHNDLRFGFNTMIRGSKLAGLIDWETAAYDPLSICILDLTHETDYNPRIWREHAGPNGTNFHHLPYRLLEDPTAERLQIATDEGAERKPFPDWELIENHGGPLGEEDFCGAHYPEDISSNDDESIVDAAEMNCDSDVDAGEDCFMPPAPGGDNEMPELIRRGEYPHLISRDWYREPVYALMKEFIHHQRGAGLGPDGEWGKLPEEYSRPLAEWDDPLYCSVTQEHFQGYSEQLISHHMVGVPAPQTSLPIASKMRKLEGGLRGRRVPTHIGSQPDANALGKEILPHPQVASRHRAYLTRDPHPLRLRPKSPPLDLAAFRRAPVATQANWRAELGRQVMAAPPPGDARVKRARDIILTRVMEELGGRSDGGKAARKSGST